MASMCSSLLLAFASLPQAVADEGGSQRVSFAEPVRLTAGGAPMGQGRMFPSPALYDLDGDGVGEMILGDLAGVLTASKRLPGDDLLGWSEPSPLRTASGEHLRFNNW